MTVLLLASAGALLAAAILSVGVAVRSGETRVYLLTAVLLLLAAGQGVALVEHAGRPLALDLPTAGAAASLAAGLLAFAAVAGISRMLRELDHAEELHWESMESVRGLSEFAARRGKALEERLPHLLDDACQRFGLEIGFVSRVIGTRYEILAVHAPSGFPVSSGAVYALDETPCRETLTSERPIARFEAANPGSAQPAIHADLQFDTYLASAIRVAGGSFGTLVFAKNGPADTRLTATHKDLVHLMAQWLGWEFEELARPEAGSAHPRVRHHRAGDLRVDALVRRAARRARRSVPKGVRIEIDPGPAHLPTAREARLPLDAILVSLVHRAAQAIPGGGVVRIEASAHEPPTVARDMLPGVAPARYVTLTVSESSGGLDPDAISRGFASDAFAETGTGTAESELLPLPAVYRMLQRAGGDLSVEVEPGRSSRFTIFLPLAEDAEGPAPRRAGATEPAPPMTQPR